MPCSGQQIPSSLSPATARSSCSVVLDAFTQQPGNDAFLDLMPAFRCAGGSLQAGGGPLYACTTVQCRHPAADVQLSTPNSSHSSLLPLPTCACSGEACSQMLGFHFFRCREDAAAQRLATSAPSGLYLAAAKMVRAGYTTLQALMAHLTPTDEDLHKGEQAAKVPVSCHAGCLVVASLHMLGPSQAQGGLSGWLALTRIACLLPPPPVACSLQRGAEQDAGGH